MGCDGNLLESRFIYTRHLRVQTVSRLYMYKCIVLYIYTLHIVNTNAFNEHNGKEEAAKRHKYKTKTFHSYQLSESVQRI